MDSANPHLLQRLQGIQQSLLAQHLGGQGLPAAVAGSERETFLREFLQKVRCSLLTVVSRQEP
jgi:hypothetical protein